MSDKFWVNDGLDGDTANILNWALTSGGSGGSGIASNDVAIFDGAGANGNDAAIMSADLNVQAVRAESGFSGGFLSAGFKINIYDIAGFDVQAGASGAWNLNNSEFNLGGDLHIAGSVADLDMTGCPITAIADITVTILKAVSGQEPPTLVLTNNKKVTLLSNLSVRSDGQTALTMETSGCELDLNGFNLNLLSTGIQTPIVLNGGTLSGGAGSTIILGGSNGLTALLPTFNSGSEVVLILETGSSDTNNYTFGGDIVCKQVIIGTNASSIFNVDLDGYNLTTVEILRVNQSTGTNVSVINLYLGEGIIDVQNIAIFSDVGATLNIHLEDSKIICRSDQNFTTGGTLNMINGTSSFEMATTGSKITFAGASLDTLKVAVATLDILDASHCGRYDFTPATIIKFKDGVTHTLDAHSTIDTTDVVFITPIPGNQYTFDNPVGMVTDGVNVKDSNALVDINAYTNVNTDSGNNSVQWLFIDPGPGPVDEGGQFNTAFNKSFNKAFN